MIYCVDREDNEHNNYLFDRCSVRKVNTIFNTVCVLMKRVCLYNVKDSAMHFRYVDIVKNGKYRICIT